jgi:hypothetical protein
MQTFSAATFLSTIQNRISGIEQDLPELSRMGEQMAAHLLAGGELFAPPIAPWWVSEFSGRAGGLMGITWGDHAGSFAASSPNDVAYIALPAKWDEKAKQQCEKLVKSPAKIFAIGEPQPEKFTDRVEGFTKLGEPSDVPGVRQFEQLLRGWLVTGEMIAACTRAGKMPHIWMSVWLEGALVRNASFYKHDNLREPWHVPLFHDRIYIPSLPALHVAREFLAELRKIQTRLVQQDQQLTTASRWIAEAKRAARHISMVAVGHCYPEILETPAETLPVKWCKSVSHIRRAHPRELTGGDVAIHLGYSPVDLPDVTDLLDRGVRFIYSSPYGRPATLKDHPNLIWLDLPWRPGDATVDVPGYSVRILPMSSCAHTMAYFSLLAGT